MIHLHTFAWYGIPVYMHTHAHIHNHRLCIACNTRAHHLFQSYSQRCLTNYYILLDTHTHARTHIPTQQCHTKVCLVMWELVGNIYLYRGYVFFSRKENRFSSAAILNSHAMNVYFTSVWLLLNCESVAACTVLWQDASEKEKYSFSKMRKWENFFTDAVENVLQSNIVVWAWKVISFWAPTVQFTISYVC